MNAPAGLVANFLLCTLTRNRQVARFSPIQFRVVTRIAMAAGLVTMAELIEVAYGDREDGGPEYAEQAIGCYIWRAKGGLAKLGLALVSTRGRGWQLTTNTSPISVSRFSRVETAETRPLLPVPHAPAAGAPFLQPLSHRYSHEPV